MTSCFFTCQLEFDTLNNNNNLKSIGGEEKSDGVWG